DKIDDKIARYIKKVEFFKPEEEEEEEEMSKKKENVVRVYNSKEFERRLLKENEVDANSIQQMINNLLIDESKIKKRETYNLNKKSLDDYYKELYALIDKIGKDNIDMNKEEEVKNKIKEYSVELKVGEYNRLLKKKS